jgi:NAD(P)-dependent dehydrogenase (short-subunit alcohol dehydrogenase family)
MEQIRLRSPGADLAFLPLGLADLDSVRHAPQVATKHARIDVLVNRSSVSILAD